MIILDDFGKKSTIKEDLEVMLEKLYPIALDLNCAEELVFIKQMMISRPSAKRQMGRFLQTQSCEDIVDMLVEEFRSGEPYLFDPEMQECSDSNFSSQF